MLSREVAEPLPGVRTAGEKLAVAPGGSPLAERVTEPGKVPLVAATVMVNSAVPPALTVCAPVGPVTVKLGGGVPVPLKVTVCGEPVALSATAIVAEYAPVEGGVKVTEIAQLVPTSSMLG